METNKHLRNPLGALLIIELMSRVLPMPAWARSYAMSAVLFLALCKFIATELHSPELRAVAARAADAFRSSCLYLDRFPNQMLGSQERNLRGVFCAFGLLLFGVSLLLQLIPPLIDSGMAAAVPGHPKQAVAALAYGVLILLARLALQLIARAWSFMRGAR